MKTKLSDMDLQRISERAERDHKRHLRHRNVAPRAEVDRAALLAHTEQLQARLDTQQAELAEQEVAALGWAKRVEELQNLLRVSEGYREAYRKAKLALYEASEGNEPMMDALMAHMPCSEGGLERAVTKAVGRVAPALTLEPAAASACLQECSSCQSAPPTELHTCGPDLTQLPF